MNAEERMLATVKDLSALERERLLTLSEIYRSISIKAKEARAVAAALEEKGKIEVIRRGNATYIALPGEAAHRTPKSNFKSNTSPVPRIARCTRCFAVRPIAGRFGGSNRSCCESCAQKLASFGHQIFDLQGNLIEAVKQCS